MSIRGNDEWTNIELFSPEKNYSYKYFLTNHSRRKTFHEKPFQHKNDLKKNIEATKHSLSNLYSNKTFTDKPFQLRKTYADKPLQQQNIR